MHFLEGHPESPISPTEQRGRRTELCARCETGESQGHDLNTGHHSDRGTFRLTDTYLVPRNTEPRDSKGEEAARPLALGSVPWVTTKQRPDSALTNPRPEESCHVVVTRKGSDSKEE